MPKTARVPAALHSELTEYASLLRALRTRQTLDLASHLSQLPPRSSQPVHSDSDLDLSSDNNAAAAADDRSQLRGTTSPPPAASGPDASSPDARSGGSSRAASAPAPAPPAPTRVSLKRKCAPTDTWTRWPLLAGDVHRPEWGLADEVQLLAAQVRRHQRAALDAPENDDGAHIDTDTDLDENESYVYAVFQRALAASTAAHLRSLLALCAAHVPRVEASLRGRLAPLSWTGVLAAAGASGLVSEDALERVGARMEAVYGSNGAGRNPFPAVNTAPIFASPYGSGLQRPSRAHYTTSHRPLSLAPTFAPARPACSNAVHSVSAARARLNALVAQREKEGDGDVLAFCGPRPRVECKGRSGRKRRRRGGRKQKNEEKDEDGEGRNGDEAGQEDLEIEDATSS